MDIIKKHCSEVSLLSQNEYEQLIDSNGYIPVFSVKGACGYFGNGQIAEVEGWFDATNVLRLPDSKRHFVVHAVGDSMLPKIHDGNLCIFEHTLGGLVNGDIVLTECNEYDYEYGGQYTIKSYYEVGNQYDLFAHHSIELRPLNSDYEPITISEENGENYRIVGVLRCVI